MEVATTGRSALMTCSPSLVYSSRVLNEPPVARRQIVNCSLEIRCRKASWNTQIVDTIAVMSLEEVAIAIWLK